MRRGTTEGRARSTGGRQCAGCGRAISSGLYCSQCLEKFRERAKVHGERIESLKSNARRKIVTDRSEVVILIANSDERNLNMIKLVLERGLPEYKILTANTILTVINILLSREISMVILDADYNGLDMLRRLREDERFQDIPVMMMSGSTERETVAEVFSLGVQDYVSKPCAPETLITRVNKVLDPNVGESSAPDSASRIVEARQSRVVAKILLIEDDIFDLRQERDILQSRLLCEVTTAQSAAEGMRILESQGADLVLVSLEMPFVNGLRFFTLVHDNPKLKNIPVVIMTATRDFSVISEIEHSGAAGYVRKPKFTEDGLAVIENRIRRRR